MLMGYESNKPIKIAIPTLGLSKRLTLTEQRIEPALLRIKIGEILRNRQIINQKLKI